MLRCPKRVWFRHSLVFRCSRVLFNFNVSQTSLYRSLIIAFSFSFPPLFCPFTFHHCSSPLSPLSILFSLLLLLSTPFVTRLVARPNPTSFVECHIRNLWISPCRTTGQFHYWRTPCKHPWAKGWGGGWARRREWTTVKGVDPDETEQVPRTRGIGSCLKPKKRRSTVVRIDR